MLSDTQELKLIDDPELKSLALEEISQNEQSLEKIKGEIITILAPPVSQANAIIEIQAGVGGDESCLFVEMLFGMYVKYANQQGWDVEITDASDGNQGGFKSISFAIDGIGAYSALQYESGTHKIQRVSPTDSAKRMHTSAASVIVIEEQDEINIDLNKNDVRVDTFCAGGPGGQHQNMTKSGVRLTHIPTNIVVSLRDGRHQRQNYRRAWSVLHSRLKDYYQSQQDKKVDDQRKNLRGDGSRAGCIRTYNFPQDRITDHRCKVSWHNIDKILNGDLDIILTQLKI